MLRWIIGGAIGGVFLGFVWAGARHFFQIELEFLAWAVGAGVGVGVQLAIREHEEDQRQTAALIAVGLAILTVLASKYIGWAISAEPAVAGREEGSPEAKREAILKAEADQAALEIESSGGDLHWPPGIAGREDAEKLDDYPPEIVEDVTRRWISYSTSERDAQIEAWAAEALRGDDEFVDDGSFRSEFSIYDIVWLLLAGITAYRVAWGWDGIED